MSALVDTGADNSMCPAQITEAVGHNTLSGKEITFAGAASSGKAWEHFINISIMKPDYKSVFHALSNVPFQLVKRRTASPILLGRNGFLDQFVIHIDFPNKLLTLELP